MKPLGPNVIPALIDGTASVVVYLRAHPETYFQYLNKDPQPSITARYRVVDLRDFLDCYVDTLNQGWVPGINPGELEDEDGNRFTVLQRGISFTDEDPPLEPAKLSLDYFFTESIGEIATQSPELILYERETPLNLLLNDFLNTHPKGGHVKFRDWLIKEQNGEWLEHSDEYLWHLQDGTDFRKSTSQVKSQLTKMKKRQRELLIE